MYGIVVNEHTRNHIKTRYETGVIDHWEEETTVFVVPEDGTGNFFETLGKWMADHEDVAKDTWLYTRVTDHLKSR